MLIKSYKDLIVWQKSMKLVEEVYALTEKFPKSEIYGLATQMKKAAISVPSNIAEGRHRGTRKDYRHFISTAFGSGAELETQIEMVKRLPFGKNIDVSRADTLIKEVLKMLRSLIKNLAP